MDGWRCCLVAGCEASMLWLDGECHVGVELHVPGDGTRLSSRGK